LRTTNNTVVSNLTRDTAVKIEGGLLRIDLAQVCYLPAALRVRPIDFLSEIDWCKQGKKLISITMKKNTTS
jgi:hypothetical protein